MTREYVLMNRDMSMLRFTCERNAFDEPVRCVALQVKPCFSGSAPDLPDPP